MSVNELLSVLNRYVEHEKRNMILVANQAEIRGKFPEKYDVMREKVVGRCIVIYPETEDALTTFLDTLKNTPSLSDAQGFLRSEYEILLSVFQASESSNLRLLRQAIFEFARFFRQVPDDIRSHADAMRYLLATFTVLSMAYHGDEGFGEDGLQQEQDMRRAIWEVNGKEEGEEPPKTSLEVLRDRFQTHPYVELHGSVISAKLAGEWIGRGHATDDVVVEELRGSAYFRILHAEAWQTLWHWPTRSAEDVAEAIGHLKKQMISKEIQHPAVIMHVTEILLDLSENGLGWSSREAAAQEMRTYIASLEEEGLLSIDYPLRLWGGPIIGQSAFGLGFMQRETDEFRRIKEYFLAALDRAFWRAGAARGARLLELVKKDANDFAAVIDNHGRHEDLPNYAHELVLAGIDAHEAAEVIFGLPPDATRVALWPFKDRWQRLKQTEREGAIGREWPDERDWMRRFRAAAEAIAAKEERIRAAQIRKMISWQLSYMDEADETDGP